MARILILLVSLNLGKNHTVLPRCSKPSRKPKNTRAFASNTKGLKGKWRKTTYIQFRWRNTRWPRIPTIIFPSRRTSCDAMIKAECSIDSHLQSMTASLMSGKEVAIVISYSGQTKDSIDVAKKAKEAGTLVISITRFFKSPLTHYSDITLLCGAREGPFQGGS